MSADFEADRAAAARLLGVAPTRVRLTPIKGRGANNRLHRVDGPTGPAALKIYAPVDALGRDRFAAETAALTLMARRDLPTPRILAADPSARAALLSWIEGAVLNAGGVAEAEAMSAFAAALDASAREQNAEAAVLGPASEACPAPQDALDQIARRRASLAIPATNRPDLAQFLESRFDPAAAAARAALTDPTRPIPRAQQTLSPSDFGLHNALKTPEGELVFLDFEYFGWDDPVKLVADAILHPGHSFDADGARALDRGLRAVYADRPDFSARLTALIPVYALRWALIMLNPFLDEAWARQRAAGAAESERSALLSRRLNAAEGMIRQSQRVAAESP